MSSNSDIYIVCGRCSEGLSFTARAETVEECKAIFRQHEQEVHNYMTGQEFVTRFTQELETDKHLMTPGAYKHALEVAKRAAGIK